MKQRALQIIALLGIMTLSIGCPEFKGPGGPAPTDTDEVGASFGSDPIHAGQVDNGLPTEAEGPALDETPPEQAPTVCDFLQIPGVETVDTKTDGVTVVSTNWEHATGWTVTITGVPMPDGLTCQVTVDGSGNTYGRVKGKMVGPNHQWPLLFDTDVVGLPDNWYIQISIVPDMNKPTICVDVFEDDGTNAFKEPAHLTSPSAQ